MTITTQRLTRASTLVELVRARAGEHPARPAFTFLQDGEAEAGRLTYGELDEAARALAARLQARGAAPGEPALLLYPPGLGFITAFFACLYAGVAAVPAYPPRTGARRRDPRLAALARDARPRRVLTTGALMARRESLAGTVPELAEADWMVTEGDGGSEGGSDSDAGAWREPLLDGDSLAFLQYTSGSTSDPRGVVVRHANLLHNQEMIRRAFDHSEHSVVVGWLPLYHDMGLIGNVLQPLYLGASCVLMAPAAFLQRPRRWLEAVTRYRATTSGGPNFAYDLCVDRIPPADREGLDLTSWRVAFDGAEPVRAATLERFAAAFAPHGFRRRAFFPCYGLAEATLFVTGGSVEDEPAVAAFDPAALAAHRVAPAAGDGSVSLVSCGRPWMEQRLAVVDPDTGAPCPPDRVGEIWVAGPSVAGGYWRRPGETARDFGARLAGEADSGAPYLRTGDLGFLRGGELFVTGRIKDLIILRGRNLYPQDVEATAGAAHPHLRPGGVAAFAVDREREERLVVVAELAPRRRAEAQPEEIAEAVRRAVAESHEARVFELALIAAGDLPKTSSGKLRRGACRAAYLAGELPVLAVSRPGDVVGEAAGAGGEPATGDLDREALLALPVEQRPAALAGELARRAARATGMAAGGLDPDRPLTAAGLDSLAAIELQAGLETDLGAAPDLSRLLAGASPRELAAELLADLEEEPGEPALTAGADPAADHPLTYGQRALLFLERLTPETTAFILVGAARVRGRVDGAGLRRALARVAERHPALTTTFHAGGGEPRQQAGRGAPPELLEEEASGWSEEELQERLEAAAYRPFDLARGPLLRLGLFRRGEEEAVLFLAVHHLVSDLWSIGLLLGELEAAYRAETAAAPEGLVHDPLAALPAPAVTYADYVRWQERLLASPRGEELLATWQRRLAGAPMVLDLPTDRPRPPVWSARGAFVGHRLSPELLAGVEELGRRAGATLYMTLLAAFQLLLHRLTGQEELLVGSPTTGRGSAALIRVMGYFINPVVLRSRLAGDRGFAHHLERTRVTVLAAFAHQELPFPLLAERLQPERDPSRSPVFQVFFVMEQARLLHERGLSAFALGDAGARMELAGLELESLPLRRRGAQFDLMLLLARLEDGLGLALEYATDLFDATTVRRFLGRYQLLLEAVVADPEAPVADLPLLSAAERAALTWEWNASAPAVGSTLPEGALLHQLFAAQVAARGDEVALVQELEELTYRRLGERSGALARRLAGMGVGPETPVALLLPRCLDLVVAILGVLEAGGAYVPLDPAYPGERLAFMLEDALRGVETPIVVSHSDLAADLALPAGARLLALDEERGSSTPVPLIAAGPDQLAYVIYTSGSTGRPKGVPVTHGNVVALLRATAAGCRPSPADVWTLFHSYAFDFSVWELWGALAYGGRLVVVPREVAMAPAAFRELLATEGVTVLNQTPSAFRQLVQLERSEGEGDGAAPLELRLVLFGGEALEIESLRPWIDRHGDRSPRLVNLYGITETTVHATWRPVEAADLETGAGSVIGRPLDHLALYLLDREGRPVPPGSAGELHLGGAGVARGYLGRPALTARRFAPDPFSALPGGRLYRSGDLARFRPGPGGWELEHLGRIDSQVKLRGFRIEPGEIEAALAAHPAVAEAVVAVAADRSGDPRLVAYVVAAGGEGAAPESVAETVAELAPFLRARLPEYMVPAVFLPLPALPRTPSGKLDRRGLPDPGQVRLPEHPAARRRPPATAAERAVARIWREILDLEEVGADDDFFEVGGHSLKATQLLARVASDLGVELPMRRLFESPTVAGLARAVAELRGDDGAAPEALPPWRAAPEERFEPFPLTDIQQAYWIGRSGLFELGTVSTQSYLELAGTGLDLERLERAWHRLVERHDMLRAVILADGTQRVLPEVPPYRMAVLDLAGLPPSAAEATLTAVRERMSHSVLPADRWPLFELRITRLGPAGEDRVRLHARLDALIYDASSAYLLLEEWMTLYRRPEAELPSLAATFRDYVLTARRMEGSAAWQRAWDYWQERAPALPPAPELPLARNPASLSRHRFVRRTLRLPAPVWQRLQARASRAGLAPSGLLLAAYAQALARWSKSPRFTLNLTLFQRLPLHPEVGRIVGDFTSLTLLEADVSGEGSFEEQARRLSRRLWQDLDHRAVSGLRVARELSRRRGGAPTVMPVVFTSTLGLEEELNLGALPGEVVYAITQTSQVWLDQQVSEEEGTLVANWDGVDELFPTGLLDDLFAAYRRLLERLAGGEEAWHLRPRELTEQLLPPEQAACFAAVNRTGDEADAPEGLLHQPLLARAAESPDRPAVIQEDVTLTLGELARRAGRVAHRLRRAGAGPEELVAVVMERGWEQAAATLGVLAAGAAYLPLDPALPRERLRHLLERGRVAVALTQERLRARLGRPAGVEPLAVDGPDLAGEAQSHPGRVALPAAAALPGGLAYVIFTSGSTGEPKGVMIEHHSALNTVLDVNRRFQVGPEDRVLALSALSFDLSVYDLFGPPAAGGAVVLPAAGGERDPAAWAAAARRHRVTLWSSVPVLAELLVEHLEAHPELAPPPLRLALLSGDWVPVRLPERLRHRWPNLQVVSLGGATEGSIWSILHPVDEVDPAAASIPYGRPMAHQSFHVLDAALAPRPAWVPGELWIGGRGLARGYWRDGARTALAFLPHPTTGERLYRTGDLGRRRPDGTIEFLGREDYQVKVRGYRVELGEIEAVLGRHPSVREAVVTAATAAGDPRGERRLAAWVVPVPAGAGDGPGGDAGPSEAEELRRFLEARLPPYMVPASFHFLEALPLTANGKVDRGALTLPEPAEEAETPPPAEPQAAARGPADPLTERIAALVAGVLEGARIDPGGLDPAVNLLELGATSLEVIRLANHLEAELGSRPSVDQFYREPTLEALVRFYRRQAAPQVPPGPGETAGAAADFEVILDPDERQAFKDRHPGLRPIPHGEGDGDGATLTVPDGGAREELAYLYRERVSHRTFSDEAIPLERFGRLLACLTAEERPGGQLKLLYPSAGALYPVQVYLHVEPGRVDGLAAGTYYHHPVEHRLVRLSRQATLEASIHDPFVNRPIFEASAFSLFLVARLSAIGPIYGANAHFFSALEAGYMGQLLMMHAPSCGLGLCPIGVLDFDRIRHLFDLEPTDVLVHTFLGGPLDPDAPRGEAVPLEEPYPWKVRLEDGREEGEL